MSLPNSNDLKLMDVAYMGQPFVFVPAKESINEAMKGMDIAYMGQPFVVNSYPFTATVIIR